MAEQEELYPRHVMAERKLDASECATTRKRAMLIQTLTGTTRKTSRLANSAVATIDRYMILVFVSISLLQLFIGGGFYRYKLIE